MNELRILSAKNQRIVAGILSGTSADGVDTVLLTIIGKGKSMKLNVIDFETFPIRSELKRKILDCSSDKKTSTEDICRLNFVIGNLFSSCILKLIKRNKLLSKDIDLIGSHGQTIYHYPSNKRYFGENSKSTLQIGDPSVIANKTGITTVGDFRTADVAAGGDGAPLVPYLDYILFSSNNKNRILINIGGISNCTYLKKSCRKEDVIAFDTGPGNMLIDSAMMILFNKKFDTDGKTAFKGKVNFKLFEFLIYSDKYFKKAFPKSTGREYYGEVYLKNILKNFKTASREDIITTITKFTAYTIYYNIRKFKADEILISGGGVRNKALMNYLNEYTGDIPVRELNIGGINPDNKEAVLFAVLASELISGIKTNLMSVTGASKNVYLGKICPV